MLTLTAVGRLETRMLDPFLPETPETIMPQGPLRCIDEGFLLDRSNDETTGEDCPSDSLPTSCYSTKYSDRHNDTSSNCLPMHQSGLCLPDLICL
jgi:hypothetical protein